MKIELVGSVDDKAQSLNGEIGIWDVESEGLNEGSEDGRVDTDDGIDGYKD